MRIVRKVPDLVEYMTVLAIGLLIDKHHGVLVAGVKLCTKLCQANELALDHFRKVCKRHLRDMQMCYMYLPLGCSLLWTLPFRSLFNILGYLVDFSI